MIKNIIYYPLTAVVVIAVWVAYLAFEVSEKCRTTPPIL